MKDLKPENILCVHPNSISKIKITNFGISKMMKVPRWEASSTSIYIAPEIGDPEEEYDYVVDFWSIGMIMYVLICGCFPESCWGLPIEFVEKDWIHISPDLKALIVGLLQKDPSRRIRIDAIQIAILRSKASMANCTDPKRVWRAWNYAGLRFRFSQTL